MKKCRKTNFGNTVMKLMLAAFFCLGVSASSVRCETLIDPKDWFVMSPGSCWHYSGDGVSGGSVENDNTVTVLDEKKDAGNGVSAARFQMTTDNPADNRNGDEQFWYVDPDDPEGRLLIYGLHNHKEDVFPSGTLLAQDIIIDAPGILIGQNGQKIGDEVSRTGTAKVKVKSGIFITTVNAAVSSKIKYTEIVPEYDTLAGTFADVLTMNIDIRVTISGNVYDVAVGDYWLKQGTGVIANNYKDLAITQPTLKIADRGKIGNARIQPDSDSLRHLTLVLQTLCGSAPEGVKNLTDINHNGSIGAEEAVYALQKSAGFRVFGITSSAFGDGDAIPAKYSDYGENVSPPVEWQNPPSDVRSYVLIVDDPDAVPVDGKVWDHWIVYDIPAATAFLPENADLSGAKQGMNSWNNAYYGGPSPPSGTAHRYYFTLYALNVAALNPAGAGKSDIKAAMYGKVSGCAQMIGTYQR